MEIVCPGCNALYNLSTEKVSTQGTELTCKRCQYRIPIKALVQPNETFNTPSADPVRSTASIVTPQSAPHPNDIRQSFPQADGFDPKQYSLSEILRQTKNGRYDNRLNRLKFKLLATAKPVLDRLLDRDEWVLRIAHGTAYYPLELLFGNGVLTMMYNRYILVATNRRLVAINTNSGMKKASHYTFQFPYNGIKKVSKGLLGTSLTLTPRQGKRRVFSAMKRGLAAELKEWIGSNIQTQAAMVSETDQYNNLCPACYVPLNSNIETCTACGVNFKSPRKATIRSLVLPGWGDIYLGHRLLGAFEIVGSLFVWFLALTLMLTGRSEDIVLGFILLLIVNGLDALLTLHMARKGYAVD